MQSNISLDEPSSDKLQIRLGDEAWRNFASL